MLAIAFRNIDILIPFHIDAVNTSRSQKSPRVVLYAEAMIFSADACSMLLSSHTFYGYTMIVNETLRINISQSKASFSSCYPSVTMDELKMTKKTNTKHKVK